MYIYIYIYPIVSFIKISYDILLKSLKQCWTFKNLYPDFYEPIDKVQNLQEKLKYLLQILANKAFKSVF